MFLAPVLRHVVTEAMQLACRVEGASKTPSIRCLSQYDEIRWDIALGLIVSTEVTQLACSVDDTSVKPLFFVPARSLLQGRFRPVLQSCVEVTTWLHTSILQGCSRPMRHMNFHPDHFFTWQVFADEGIICYWHYQRIPASKYCN